MSERKASWQDNVTGLYLGNKYWFLGSIIFFLLAASVYLIFTPVTYKVATRIVVKNQQDPEEIIKDVKSNTLLQKVIGQLPLQVVYYQKKASGEIELSKDALPIRFVPAENTTINSSAELKVFIVNSHQYKILKDRTFMYFLFDEPVNYYSFAKFRIIKGPGFKTGGGAAIVRVFSDSNLLQQYRKNLDAKLVGDGHKNIELSLTGNSLKKGQNFLDKLVEVYNASNQTANLPAIAGDIDLVSEKRLKYELAFVKIKSVKFRDQQAMLLSEKENADNSKAHAAKQNKQYLNVLTAIEPYANRSADQFVQIPYRDEVNDSELKKLIGKYNSTQLEKQHELQEQQVDNLKIAVLNTRLSTIKQSITESIVANKNELNGIHQSPSTRELAAVNDSISKINRLLNLKQQEYDALLKNHGSGAETISANPKETIIEKSTEHVVIYPKIGYVYLFALLIGLILPLIVPYFKLRVNL